jgi:L-Ala-D/L-Glu epimerase
VPVAADESLRSQADLGHIIKQGGVSAVNIKTAKLGLVQAHEIVLRARQAGLSLMVGGMVETELSMSASACLAAGVGGFKHVDLDTPLFMKERPLEGGYRQQGPLLDLSVIARGHGVQFVSH